MPAGGWHHDNAHWKPKKCAVCETKFTPRSGVHKFCSSVCKGKWKYISGESSTENQYKRISGNWDRYFSRLLRAGGRKRNALSVADLKKVFEQQNGKCALTGAALTCELQKGKQTLTNASVDRIQAGGEYVVSNIQLVCIAVNKWRGAMPVAEFVKWCKQVANFAERK